MMELIKLLIEGLVVFSFGVLIFIGRNELTEGVTKNLKPQDQKHKKIVKGIFLFMSFAAVAGGVKLIIQVIIN